jgi:hypothetical protein
MRKFMGKRKEEGKDRKDMEKQRGEEQGRK